jgi:phage shock protein PspC (stress-responsive transcriptional regulator)
MARKTARKARRKRSGEFEKRVGDFTEEVGEFGERFGKRVEKHGKEFETSFHRTFGLVGPLISGVIGVVFLALLTWVIAIINSKVDSWILSEIDSFLAGNIGIFFLLFLFFSYSSYFSKFHRRVYRLFSPVSIALGAAVCLWIASGALQTVNIAIGNPVLSLISFYMIQSLLIVFWLFLLVGYLVLAIIIATEKTIYHGYEVRAVAERRAPAAGGGVNRLYRSGKDRILGGVCGGVAEYLDVDPVIIRLLWVIGTLAWGFGILLYIICWVAIPRNPNHKWK